MDKGKVIEVSASTLVGLKAELFRKQEEAKRKRDKQQNVPITSLKLGKITTQVDSLGKANPGVGSRITKDQEYRILEEEDNDALAASRKKLEEKAALYEKMMSSSNTRPLPENDDEVYMVDFQRKTLNAQQNRAHETNSRLQSEDSYEPKSEQEEWIDYTDSLGRSRRCLKTDLPRMISMDLDLQQKPEKPAQDDQNFGLREEPTAETDLNEVQIIPETPIGPTHYQNVQFNEIRSHGVGYFGFSQSEEERKKQMETLNQLRNQTMMQKAKLEKVKEKRKEALKARLKKVKQRKLLKEGNVLLPDSESSDSEQEKTVNAQEVEVVKDEPVVPKEIPTKVRPWDRGKIGPRVIQPFRQASQKEWVDKQRDERVSEFAPPSSYYESDPVEEMFQFFKQQKNTYFPQPPSLPPQQSPENSNTQIPVNDIPLPNE